MNNSEELKQGIVSHQDMIEIDTTDESAFISEWELGLDVFWSSAEVAGSNGFYLALSPHRSLTRGVSIGSHCQAFTKLPALDNPAAMVEVVD